MTTRYITLKGQRYHLISTTNGKALAEAEAKRFGGIVRKLDSKQKKYEEANYGVYVKAFSLV